MQDAIMIHPIGLGGQKAHSTESATACYGHITTLNRSLLRATDCGLTVSEHPGQRIRMHIRNIRYSANSGRVLEAAGYRPTGAASRRGIVNPARCLVTVRRWVWVSGRAASRARSAGR